MFFDVLSKSTTVTEFVDEVVVIGSSQHLNELDDVGVADFGENGDLVIGEFTQFGSMLEFFHVHHLYCKVLVRLSILGLVDITVLTLSYFLEQHIIFNHLVHVL